jgi:hypothetical protein
MSELIDNYSKKRRRVIYFYIVFYKNPKFKFVGLKMAKIQASDGLMGKRNIAILNIDSILNKKGAKMGVYDPPYDCSPTIYSCFDCLLISKYHSRTFTAIFQIMILCDLESNNN